MKSTLRKINVNGIDYYWNLKNNTDGDGSNLVNVFLNKKKVHSELITGSITISPKLIRGIIETFK